MDIKRLLPKRVIIIEVPINQNSNNSKAMTTIIGQLSMKHNVVVLESPDLTSTKVSTKWFW